MPLFEEVASVLVDAGICTLNTNLFGSLSRETPQGGGPYVTLIEYGSPPERRVHNDVSRASGDPVVLGEASGVEARVQVVVRAVDFPTARLMAKRCHRALNIRNRRLGTPSSVSVTALTRSGSVAAGTLASDQGWVSGQRVIISGALQSAYNGVAILEMLSGTTFRYPVVGSPVTPATGSVVATFPGTWYREIQPLGEPFELGHDATGRPRVSFNLRIAKGPS